jgi:hypothetical protein
VYCHIAFFMLENAYFRELICRLNNSLGSLLPRASSTIRNWVKEEYKRQKEQLQLELKDALSNVHISFDMWTSPNSYAIISIYSHFINKRGKRKIRLLAFRRLYGTHSGDNQATALLEVINEFGLESKIGYFVCDNAKSNDTAVDAVLKKLYPYLSEKQRRARRLRCFGHITNLCARALLLGKGAGKAMSELSRKVSKGAFEAVDAFWRGKGAVGRLHNIIIYIRCSPQRLQAFAGTVIGGRLKEFDELQAIQDNQTRWNSWYYSIGRALNIRERINKFCRQYKPSDKHDTSLKDNTLSRTHWHQLDRIHDCLKVFEVGTLDTQGQKRYLFDYYPSLAWMLHEVDNFKVEFADEATRDSTFTTLSECCEHSWDKIEKYYVKCDETPIVYAAVILNPTKKHHWFKQEWQDGTEEQRTWIEAVKVQVQELWRTEYKISKAVSPPQASKDDERDLHIRLHNYKRLKVTRPASPTDALDSYLNTDPELDNETFDPLQYWYDRRHTAPDLAKFAFDTLAIPIMSDDTERSFSAGRDMITYRRSRLHDDIIEACSCLRSWYGKPKKNHKNEAPFDDEEVVERQFNELQGIETPGEEQDELFDDI